MCRCKIPILIPLKLTLNSFMYVHVYTIKGHYKICNKNAKKNLIWTDTINQHQLLQQQQQQQQQTYNVKEIQVHVSTFNVYD